MSAARLVDVPQRVRELLHAEPSILIGGEWTRGSGELFEAEDPSTATSIAGVVNGSRADVEMAVDAAREAQPEWVRLDYYGRYLRLDSLADLIEQHSEELAFLDALEGGNPIGAMRHDVAIAIRQLRYMAALGLSVRGETIPADNARDFHYTLPEPYGVVGRIIPFNHPAMFAVTKLVSPLIAGNTVVLKPAEQTSLSALYLGRLITQVLPEGVVSIVTGDGATGAALVSNEHVKRIAFTGSVDTGRRIQADAAAVGIKHITLELGGKNPMVVCADADLEPAVTAAVLGMNLTVCQGQSCGSNSRIFIHEALYQRYLERVVDRLRELKVGIAYDESTDMGPVVNETQFDRVLRYVELGVEEGGRLVYGGHSLRRHDGSLGYFIEPTLFEGLAIDSRTAREEIFGPVLSVFRWADMDEAVHQANSVSYGLTASVWTRDVARAHELASQLQAGYIWINEHGPHYIGTPFGGYKNSGVGKEESLEEIRSYLQTKSVHVPFKRGEPTTDG